MRPWCSRRRASIASAGRRAPRRAGDMAALGYDPGDLHVHVKRATDADDRILFDLMAAEEIRFAGLLAYNEPAGPYHGAMDAMDTPQLRGLGGPSIRQRGPYRIL